MSKRLALIWRIQEVLEGMDLWQLMRVLAVVKKMTEE